MTSERPSLRTIKSPLIFLFSNRGKRYTVAVRLKTSREILTSQADVKCEVNFDRAMSGRAVSPPSIDHTLIPFFSSRTVSLLLQLLGQLLPFRAPFANRNSTYHLSTPGLFRTNGETKKTARIRGGWGGVRRVRTVETRRCAGGNDGKELQVTRPAASRWISNYSSRGRTRRFNTNESTVFDASNLH